MGGSFECVVEYVIGFMCQPGDLLAWLTGKQNELIDQQGVDWILLENIKCVILTLLILQVSK